MKKSSLTTFMLLFIATVSNGAIVAQDQTPIDLARAFPPTFIPNKDQALAQIDWQLRQLRRIREHQEADLRQASDQVARSREEATALAEKLPLELRFANQDVRAEVIGTCLQVLLSANLEVASHDEIISQLSMELEKAQEKPTEIEQLGQKQRRLKLTAFETKFDQARNELERNEKLYERGAVNMQELDRSRYNLQIAEYELAQAKLEAEIEDSSRENEVAQRLVEARIELQPIKARAAAAERFLKLFSESNEVINRIQELNREYEAGVEVVEELNRKMRSSSEQIAELESLKELIQSSLKDAAKAKLEQEND
jgi:hypothetical protein